MIETAKSHDQALAPITSDWDIMKIGQQLIGNFLNNQII